MPGDLTRSLEQVAALICLLTASMGVFMSAYSTWRQGRADASTSANLPNGDVNTAIPCPKRVIVMSPHPDDDGKSILAPLLLSRL